MSEQTTVRCAIYTRKSTEDGLEQDFNSLDAQRESGEHCIASHKAEDWVCLPDRYDDGGYSGGNTDRPALTKLMAAIEAGEVDCVVVYKVDRLSRSLLDFARLMRVFEERGVSFVSVTQEFNTASSMGRLMLNILLSFAQFERETISERTRDKIALARRRGKWAGGRPVLGYDLQSLPGGTRLAVNEEEAGRVRRIFAMYLEHRSILKVAGECRRLGWVSKQWTTKAGKPMGGHVLDKSRLYALLTNPVYTGKVRHNESVYEGEHDAILDPDVFDEVQTQLRLNGKTGGSRVRNAHGALLKGLVRCKACGCGMAHSFSSAGKGKSRKVYRYYVCTNAQRKGWVTCKGPSIPAAELESFVLDQIREVMTRDAAVDAVVRRAMALLAESSPQLVVDMDEVVGAAEAFDPVWETMTQSEREELIRSLVAGVEYDAEAGTISVSLRDDEQGERAA
jgi:site-specific DNA recombinase